MQSKRARLDRFISAHLQVNRRDVKPLIAQGRLWIDGAQATDAWQFIDEFTEVIFDDQVLQHKQPVYIMLHKPIGVVSATKDAKHNTVIDLINSPIKNDLHIVGRLDFNSSGLMLLTNNGRWSRLLTSPDTKVEKCYRVTLSKPIDDAYKKAFAAGMHFPYENIITRPARLEIIDNYTADVYLIEGRYHQIKRMFGRFQNEVLTLHRTAIGKLLLDTALASGDYRTLNKDEVDNIIL